MKCSACTPKQGAPPRIEQWAATEGYLTSITFLDVIRIINWGSDQCLDFFTYGLKILINFNWGSYSIEDSF